MLDYTIYFYVNIINWSFMFSYTNRWQRPSAHLSPRWRIWWLWMRSCASCLSLRWILRYEIWQRTSNKNGSPWLTPCHLPQHHSYRSFLGITCLMQISTREEDFIIDTLELRSEMYILNEAFTDPSIVKVMEMLHKCFGRQRESLTYNQKV